jgi:uncharacterized repeat protein (TIGR03803 family)
MSKIAQRIVFLAVMLIPFSITGPTFAGTVGFKTVINFHPPDGQPNAPLIKATDGNFYGTTIRGGANDDGTVFRLSITGQLTTIYSFCTPPRCFDGAFPYEGLVQTSDGNFYGTTNGGSTATFHGTVFKLTPQGTLTTLYRFNGPDGDDPIGGLIQARDGNIYGVTAFGGPNDYGTVFKITSDGTLTTIYDFCSQPSCADGGHPLSLMQATDGNFYGTTGGNGTIFQLTPDGVLTTLYNFCSQPNCADGAFPLGVIQATDGNFYGTTEGGGTGTNPVCKGSCGTVFKFNLDGTLTTLHNFDSADGRFPEAPLVQATDEDFYGTTSDGGSGAQGTLFRITSDGTLTTLRRFKGPNGANPVAALIQSPGGNLWGTTAGGGTGGTGTIYQVRAGLKPFVEVVPDFGSVGDSVTLLGVQMAHATSVTFNGVPATFQIISNYAIKATVPSGATSGPVRVAASKQILTSNKDFQLNAQ